MGLKGMKRKQVTVTQGMQALRQRALTAEFSLPAEMYCLIMWKETNKLTPSKGSSSSHLQLQRLQLYSDEVRYLSDRYLIFITPGLNEETCW